MLSEQDKKEKRRAYSRKYYRKCRDELREYEIDRCRALGLPPPPLHGNCIAMRNRSKEEKLEAKKQLDKAWQAQYRAKNRSKRAKQQRECYARKKKEANLSLTESESNHQPSKAQNNEAIRPSNSTQQYTESTFMNKNSQSAGLGAAILTHDPDASIRSHDSSGGNLGVAERKEFKRLYVRFQGPLGNENYLLPLDAQLTATKAGISQSRVEEPSSEEAISNPDGRQNNKLELSFANDEIWNRGLKEMNEFVLEHGHFGVPADDVQCRALWEWLQDCKREYRKYKNGETSLLTRDRILQLIEEQLLLLF